MSKEAVSELMRALDSTDSHKCAEAAIRLGELDALAALPKLRELASRDNDTIALAAMYACWRLGEDRIDIDRVVDALGSEDEEGVQQAIHMVCAIGSPMIEKLTPVLNETPGKAAIAMRALDDIHEPAANQAIRALRSKDPGLTSLQQQILADWDEDMEAFD